MKKSALVVVVTAVITGCAANPVTYEGQRVRYIDNDRVAVEIERYCEWLGDVSGNQGNFFTADLTSERNMMEGARNDLRNEAGKLGATHVVVQSHSSVQPEYAIGSIGHNFTGSAFKCDSQEIKQARAEEA
ncbi:DUF4156 domain-containing protein [Photobacterium rosenbergii]|uniref:DUF4156 domain-containing protein n=1 Tax=Photobacterium rosenbergii TaxID=294936 RepID=A0ABU3ZI16_9GAMM|nr:DUF4156 domain-containing protein [Photobacterium rosenbergii]MDV5169744.1 DUF4156 domain-containing protein [Photobacterium rosenbergii]